ncbi:prepilin peptidase [Arthrobacter bambusae]|jgi:leader peptidase (prepilin peptidase) / N-methyltransferase|uniref:prepilin peptidase n=1 Tax=Arthrobacter bambusae TaxID=1338426 RepID=UPI002780EB2B|nr:prepilin peptidase [Arthrobacter bambusae]MDQ0211849.1 leader peptidase (prepilin peptidase)/N-methyltransferase [Arthrobacter bambusae]MDQ0236415.1 leader peptidase (prepilin peptidase)/N-methyltransferase [Arthrobacter bambusae]
MTATAAEPLLVAAFGLLGLLTSLLAEALIARSLPRLGGLPSPGARFTTAVTTAVLFAVLTLRFGLSPTLPAYLFLAVLAVQLSRVDVTHHLLPNPLVLLLFAAGLILLSTSAALLPDWSGLLRATVGAVVLFLGYLILGLISPGALGMGDVKLSAPLGMYLGYLGWTQVFYGGLLGFVVGGVLTVLTLRVKRGIKPSEVPHGPAMFAAAIGVVLLVT